jgi:hypothetical protein
MLHAEMMARMSARELQYWFAYYLLELEEARRPSPPPAQTPADMLKVLDALNG